MAAARKQASPARREAALTRRAGAHASTVVRLPAGGAVSEGVRLPAGSGVSEGVSARTATARPRAGSSLGISKHVPRAQRLRLLASAVALVSEEGYERMSVVKISRRAGVSRRTFYDLFEDREACFLAAFDEAVTELESVVVPAWASGGAWAERVRAGLAALLESLDANPRAASLLVVDALGVGRRVVARRASVLDALARVIDEGRAGAPAGGKLLPLTAEGVVGAVFGVVHARVLERASTQDHASARAQASASRRASTQDRASALARASTSGRASLPERTSASARSSASKRGPAPLSELLNPLMAMIVLPYLGSAAAQEELTRRAAKRPVRRCGDRSEAEQNGAAAGPVGVLAGAAEATDPFEGLTMRLTYRTLRVLEVIAAAPGASNREIADSAGVQDQGQISKLLRRLEGLGLLTNTAAESDCDRRQPSGAPNAWHLTPRGEELERATRRQNDKALTGITGSEQKPTEERSA